MLNLVWLLNFQEHRIAGLFLICFWPLRCLLRSEERKKSLLHISWDTPASWASTSDSAPSPRLAAPVCLPCNRRDTNLKCVTETFQLIKDKELTYLLTKTRLSETRLKKRKPSFLVKATSTPPVLRHAVFHRNAVEGTLNFIHPERCLSLHTSWRAGPALHFVWLMKKCTLWCRHHARLSPHCFPASATASLTDGLPLCCRALLRTE